MTQGTLDFDAKIRARARKGDPRTSHEAADSFTFEQLSELKRKIFWWFVRRGGRATDEELETSPEFAYLGPTTASKRRTDLVRSGFLRDSGEEKTNRRGRNQIIWEVAVDWKDFKEEAA